jgi:RNA polymerase sigma factor (TIGR02999 family)
MNAIPTILEAAEQGEPHAAAQLLPLVYEELRRLAADRLAREKPGQTLQPTALVHEAYLRLVAAGGAQRWDSPGHFFAAAAEAMRRILVENARRKRRLRHGGGRRRVSLDLAGPAEEGGGDDVLAVDEALGRLARQKPAAAAVVKLRYFAGLTAGQAAAALGISLRAANRHWAFTRAWLFRQLRQAGQRGEVL